jgi:membrane protease YdiL (CAAX protease family)
MLAKRIALPTPENDSIENDSIGPRMNAPSNQPSASTAVAPAWHTIVLVAGILALSIHSASSFSAAHGPINRLRSYGLTAAMEAVIFAWVVVGLRLKKISLRSLLGSCTLSFQSITQDLGFALVFWITSLMVLGSLGIAWSGVEAALTHRPPLTRAVGQTGQTGQAKQSGQAEKAAQVEQALRPDPSQLEAVRALAQLAPANGEEIAAWTLLCLLAGFVEEVVFRGYLQRQFISWARGGVGVAVFASAVLFGAAHAYQGVRGMALIAVFGALFSLLALYRRSLRAGIFAHTWHDLITGLTLALLRASHVI